MQSWLMASIIIIYCLLNIFGIILLAKINPGVQWQWPYFVMSGVGIFVAFFVVSEKYVYGLISIGIMLLGIFYQYIPANPILNFGQKTETKSIKNLFYKYTPRVSKTFLFLCAGFVWCFAGYKILGMGITDMMRHWLIPMMNLCCALFIFFIFFKFIFLKMFKKHCHRIYAYGKEKVCVFAFFDVKGYIMMGIMITLGILLRNLHLISPLYLGTFYTGLGLSLGVAGICFFVMFFYQFIRKAKNV